MAQHSSLHVGGAKFNNLTNAQDARLAEAGLLALNGPGPLDVRPGILYAPGNPGLVTGTSSTSPWQYSVNAGTFVTTKGTGDGPHISSNDGVVLVSTTAPPASNSRYDLIYVQQLDADATISPDASSSCIIGVLQGVVSSTPAIPATPAGATVLATALVLSTATTGTSGAGVTIDPTVSRFTTVRGEPIPVRNTTERGELTPYTGACVRRLDQHGAPVEVYDAATSQWWGNTVQTLSYGANFGPPPSGYSSLVLSVSGKTATLAGHASWVTGTGGGLVLASIPTPYWPAYDVPFTSVSQNNSTGATGSTYRGVVAASSGVVSLNPLATTTQVPANVIPILATWLVN